MPGVGAARVRQIGAAAPEFNPDRNRDQCKIYKDIKGVTAMFATVLCLSARVPEVGRASAWGMFNGLTYRLYGKFILVCPDNDKE